VRFSCRISQKSKPQLTSGESGHQGRAKINKASANPALAAANRPNPMRNGNAEGERINKSVQVKI
jgi:hypothetical protein